MLPRDNEEKKNSAFVMLYLPRRKYCPEWPETSIMWMGATLNVSGIDEMRITEAGPSSAASENLTSTYEVSLSKYNFMCHLKVLKIEKKQWLNLIC